MKRLTVDKTAREMSGVELAHNCMYARDRWARYRDFDKDMDLFDFIREFANAEKLSCRQITRWWRRCCWMACSTA